MGYGTAFARGPPLRKKLKKIMSDVGAVVPEVGCFSSPSGGRVPRAPPHGVNGFFVLPKDERSKDSVQRRTPETETPVDLMPTSEGVAMCAVPLMPRSLASPDRGGARAGGAGAS